MSPVRPDEPPASDVSEMQAFLTKDMREHPEEWLWFWKKVLKYPDGRPVPEDEIRRFWEIDTDHLLTGDGVQQPLGLPVGFVYDEPRKCALCREHCGTFYVPLKSYLHPECLSAFTDDAA